jgi:hypothetical protein
MTGIPVASEGKTRFYFEEDDVRQICRIMRCSDCMEECINLMVQGSMECPLCYAMMKVFRKPCKISGPRSAFTQKRPRVSKIYAQKAM